MSDIFREFYMGEFPVDDLRVLDEEVLRNIVDGMEFLYNRPYRNGDSDYTIKRKEFLPFLRAIRRLIKENQILNEEVIALSSRVIGEPNGQDNPSKDEA
ncbi:hypothetical protein [Rhizobium phage RHEph16]|uniref:Uncharacterized protein n=1 Tax=Rhizobium phage RHEph16 TaxID=2836132 RepID=A0AAE7VMC7_9CAUD|nr:hypothetical protein PP750_gp91 [Rhizobium phage RHEph16]QXV74400.1 hypothetical protein [Rhizobium phage RHEph16]